MSFEKPKSNENRDGFCFDTLCALVERGPLEAGNIPSKGGLGDFLQKGYAVSIISNGQQGYYAAVDKGVQLYINHVLPGSRLKDAIAKRRGDWAEGRAQRAIADAKRK